MKVRGESNVWTVTVEFEETAEQTEAKATVEHGGGHLGGWGRAKRNPSDPDVPRIGEELAAARALSDLAHRLLEAAAAEIERYEGTTVVVHD